MARCLIGSGSYLDAFRRIRAIQCAGVAGGASESGRGRRPLHADAIYWFWAGGARGNLLGARGNRGDVRGVCGRVRRPSRGPCFFDGQRLEARRTYSRFLRHRRFRAAFGVWIVNVISLALQVLNALLFALFYTLLASHTASTELVSVPSARRPTSAE